MSEVKTAGKVEVVARAMHERNRLNVSAFVIAQGKDPKTVDLHQLRHWEELPDEGRSVACGLARAAIEAMREPTEAMVDAGAIAEGDGNLEAEARNLWSAMIGAALKEG